VFEQRFRTESFFLKDISGLRESARAFLREPPLPGNGGAQVSIDLLQTVLAAEIVCVLRYTMISVSHDGLKNGRIGAEFQENRDPETCAMLEGIIRDEEDHTGDMADRTYHSICPISHGDAPGR